MLWRKKVCLAAAWMALAHFALAQSPAVLNYQGRLSVNGAPFTGDGFFVFSLHDTNGVILWASGDFPQTGTTNLPAAAWRLPVRNGAYRVRLGDTAAGMPALNAANVLAAQAPFLRVWFNDGRRGWRAAGDVPLKSALNLAAVPAAGPTIGGAGGSQMDMILRELRDLRALVQQLQSASLAAAPAAPQIVTVPLGDSPSQGRADAPLVLLEFTDFQCPYCKRAHEGALGALQKKFVDSGKLRFISRNLPLAFHTNAAPAAHAALCAMQQQQYWPMRERLFAINTALTRTNFLRTAAELKLNTELFRACIDGQAFASQLARDQKDAEDAGITGTPTFVLGKAAEGKITGLLMVGIQPLAAFEAEIEKQLAAK
jgi:protein-disulfide isomerase